MCIRDRAFCPYKRRLFMVDRSRFYHIVSVQNVVGKASCADFIALCGDTGIDELHTFLKVKMFLSGFGREDNHNIICPLYV